MLSTRLSTFRSCHHALSTINLSTRYMIHAVNTCQARVSLHPPISLIFLTCIHPVDLSLSRHMSNTSDYPPVIPRRSRSRSRRHSSVSFSSRPSFIENVPRISGLRVKFKRKGALRVGVTLGEAQSDMIRLSSNDAYTFRDMHADHRGKINVKIQVSGDPELGMPEY